MDKSRDRHIKWAIGMVIGSKRRVPHQLRVSAAKNIASLAWPKELIPNFREKLWSSGAASIIINLSRTDGITLYNVIDYEV